MENILVQLQSIMLLCIQINQIEKNVVTAELTIKDYVGSGATLVRVEIMGAGYNVVKKLEAKIGTTMHNDDLSPIISSLKEIKQWSERGIEFTPTPIQSGNFGFTKGNRKIQPMLLNMAVDETLTLSMVDYVYSSITMASRNLKLKDKGEWKISRKNSEIIITRIN